MSIEEKIKALKTYEIQKALDAETNRLYNATLQELNNDVLHALRKEYRDRVNKANQS